MMMFFSRRWHKFSPAPLITWSCPPRGSWDRPSRPFGTRRPASVTGGERPPGAAGRWPCPPAASRCPGPRPPPTLTTWGWPGGPPPASGPRPPAPRQPTKESRPAWTLGTRDRHGPGNKYLHNLSVLKVTSLVNEILVSNEHEGPLINTVATNFQTK